jgi:hypothetical protein
MAARGVNLGLLPSWPFSYRCFSPKARRGRSLPVCAAHLTEACVIPQPGEASFATPTLPASLVRRARALGIDIRGRMPEGAEKSHLSTAHEELRHFPCPEACAHRAGTRGSAITEPAACPSSENLKRYVSPLRSV